MQQSDLVGISRSGAQARDKGVGYFDNPHLADDIPLKQWLAVCIAWSGGWLERDAGRDQDIARLMRVRYW